jgi:hypothetical protein
MTNFTNATVKRADKLIGLEIEFFGVHYQTVVTELNNAGVAVSYKGYTHVVTHGAWKLVTDVSVTSTGTGAGKGLELVSPPLTMDQMDAQMKIISEVFNRIGAKVDKTCGVHVHHEIDDLNAENVKNIYKLYNKHIETIDGIMPKSRRSESRNGYCKPLDATLINRIENATSIQEIQSIAWDRYYTINFTSYVKYGTVEFRQHSGSYDYTKIMNWIRITQSLVATAKEKKTVKPLSEKANKTVTFNKEIGIYHTVQGVYIRDRKAELRKKYKEVAA